MRSAINESSSPVSLTVFGVEGYLLKNVFSSSGVIKPSATRLCPNLPPGVSVSKWLFQVLSL
jgi:hypothetical protein